MIIVATGQDERKVIDIFFLHIFKSVSGYTRKIIASAISNNSQQNKNELTTKKSNRQIPLITSKEIAERNILIQNKT